MVDEKMILTDNNCVQGVYLAEDIQHMLALGRSATYDFLHKAYEQKGPFRVIKIGKLYRVPKNSFDKWLFNNEAS